LRKVPELARRWDLQSDAADRHHGRVDADDSGYLRSTPVERFYRGARRYEGTSEVQRDHRRCAAARGRDVPWLKKDLGPLAGSPWPH